ncbi:MAG: YfjI family protein [Methylomonas sp.]|nr:YfjI family protein [Methylomonas sp.]
MNLMAKLEQVDVAQIMPPEPLRASLPAAKPYPVEQLGDILGGAAQALHESIKAPLGLCCQSVLAAASFAAQSHFDVMLPWGARKPLSLFLLTVADSGERKSAVDDVVLGAAKAQERLEMTNYQIEFEHYEAELMKWKAASDAANKKTSKPKTQAGADYAQNEAHEVGPKPKAPIMPLRFVTDPTVEGLYKLLVTAQPSIALFSDEGGLLIGGNALNSENALKTMARWCKLWNGSPFDRVRAGDGSGCLYGRRMAMHQLAQPDVMQKLLSDRMANGQGLLARCLVAWPESTIGKRHIEAFENPKDRREVKRLFVVLKTLAEATPRTNDGNLQELDPVELPLSVDAQQMAIDAVNQFENLMAAGADLSELKDRASKATEIACRIAGVMSVIENGMAAREITGKHLESGLILMQWYLAEALRIQSAAIVPQSVLDAESLSRWLESRNVQEYTTRTILNKGPNQLRDRSRLHAAIGELVSNGYHAPNDHGAIIDGKKAKLSWRVLHHVV